ncbi:hypothetical protein ACIGNX_10060 [Actinosynnema sp. NPDC053489]|uniref:hypothetical protein n=1 Tax=Actinosynnema sp. NPDC053489 TaxID=3363916 RepID=UPI0037C613A3
MEPRRSKHPEPPGTRRPLAARAVRAWPVAAVASGAPSTVHALLTGGDVLRSTRAAATVAGGAGVIRGALVHLGVSALWTGVAAAVDRRWPLGVGRGAVAGAVVAVVDPGVVARWFPAVRRLPQAAQWADHVAFGALVGAVLRSTVDGRGAVRSSPAGRRPARVLPIPRCRAWR